MENFELLIKDGNIGFYNSCEITEIYMFPKENNKAIYNLFTLVTFEEKLFEGNNKKFITDNLLDFEYYNNRKKLIYQIGIKQYHLSLESVKNNFYKLKEERIWCSNNQPLDIDYSFLKYLTKEFIPSNENISERSPKIRLNNCLKNNFFNGSYILEFFDEDKQKFNFLIEEDSHFENLSNQIKNLIPINLYKNMDRLGNFIFQFPITLCKIDYNKKEDNLVNFEVHWNNKLKDIPDCFIEIESLIGDCLFDFCIEEYDKSNLQVFSCNSNSLLNFKFFRKDNNLILFSSKGKFLNKFLLNTYINTSKQRYFEFKDGIKPISGKIDLISKDLDTFNNNFEYYEHISRSQNRVDKEELIRNFRFKQYNSNLYNEDSNAKNDLIELIQKNCKNGVYLWDPFLSPKDIINTLFYANIEYVPLRALGSINKNVTKFYKKEHLINLKDSFKDVIYSSKSSDEMINELKDIFTNFEGCYSFENSDKISYYKNQFKLIHGNFEEGLNLEFKVQHSGYGWPFHDRFIIFPGNSKTFENPKAYSLGTSINSFGKHFHIIQEVSYPQAILDEFNKLWDELGEECVVWKYPS